MSKHLSILWAILAAALYAVNAPVSQLLLQEATPTMMAAMLSLGAGIGMLLLGMARQQLKMGKNEQKLTRKDFHLDRKSTRLNSSHISISTAAFSFTKQ